MKKKLLTLTCAAALCVGSFVGTASAGVIGVNQFNQTAIGTPINTQSSMVSLSGANWNLLEGGVKLLVNIGITDPANLPAIEFASPIKSLTLDFFNAAGCCATLLDSAGTELSFHSASTTTLNSNGSQTFFAENYAGFSSFRFGSTTQANDLTVVITGGRYTPTPIPGALVLLGSGLMGLVGIRRRFIG